MTFSHGYGLLLPVQNKYKRNSHREWNKEEATNQAQRYNLFGKTLNAEFHNKSKESWGGIRTQSTAATGTALSQYSSQFLTHFKGKNRDREKGKRNENINRNYRRRGSIGRNKEKDPKITK
jgi:hypothetical protein